MLCATKTIHALEDLLRCQMYYNSYKGLIDQLDKFSNDFSDHKTPQNNILDKYVQLERRRWVFIARLWCLMTAILDLVLYRHSHDKKKLETSVFVSYMIYWRQKVPHTRFYINRSQTMWFQHNRIHYNIASHRSLNTEEILAGDKF